jgi:hypothetical protein
MYKEAYILIGLENGDTIKYVKNNIEGKYYSDFVLVDASVGNALDTLGITAGTYSFDPLCTGDADLTAGYAWGGSNQTFFISLGGQEDVVVTLNASCSSATSVAAGINTALAATGSPALSNYITAQVHNTKYIKLVPNVYKDYLSLISSISSAATTSKEFLSFPETTAATTLKRTNNNRYTGSGAYTYTSVIIDSITSIKIIENEVPNAPAAY